MERVITDYASSLKLDLQYLIATFRFLVPFLLVINHLRLVLDLDLPCCSTWSTPQSEPCFPLNSSLLFWMDCPYSHWSGNYWKYLCLSYPWSASFYYSFMQAFDWNSLIDRYYLSSLMIAVSSWAISTNLLYVGCELYDESWTTTPSFSSLLLISLVFCAWWRIFKSWVYASLPYCSYSYPVYQSCSKV